MLPAISLLLVSCAVTSVHAKTAVVPDSFPTIQAGIDSWRDTVLVRAGHYDEDLVLHSGVILAAIPSEAGGDTVETGGLSLHYGKYEDFPGLPDRRLIDVRGFHFAGPVRKEQGSRYGHIAFAACRMDSGVSLPLSAYTNHVSINSCTILNGVSITMYGSASLTNNTVLGGGIYVSAEGTYTIRGNHVHGPAAYGIRAWSDGDGFLDSNTVIGADVGLYRPGPGSGFGPVRDNTITDGSGSGIVSDTDYGTIEGNLVQNCGGYGIDTFGGNPVRWNIILACQTGGIRIRVRSGSLGGNVVGRCGGTGIEVPANLDGTGFCYVRRNTCYLNSGPGFSIAAPNADITNNIAYGNLGVGLSYLGAGTPSLACNDWFANTGGATSGTLPGPTDLAVDPLFCDQGQNDVHLSAGSPLLGASDCGPIGVLGQGCRGADPFFAAKTDFATGRGPSFVAIGDLNGDGKPDLATANVSSNTVSVLLGNGNGAFGARTDFTTGSQPNSVAIGDLNGDGKPDLVTSDYCCSNTVSVLLGNGDGTFGTSRGFATGSNPHSVAIGDLNGDGKPDLATANYYASTVSVLLGNGDGTFGAKTDFGVGGNPASVVIEDLSGDGKPDLSVANTGYYSPGSTVSVLINNGDGTFGAKTDFATGANPVSLAIADLNGDGHPDLSTANYPANYPSNTVSVLLGNGDGTFGAKTDLWTWNGSTSVAVGDLNGDGKPDLAIPGSYNVVSMLLGNGDGTFGAGTDFGTGRAPSFVAIGDLNGDGKPDLATANEGSNTVSVLLNISLDVPTPTLVESFRAEPTAEGIRIEWQLSDPSAFQSIELHRGISETGPWLPVQQVAQVQGGVTSVLDDVAAAGQTQWYRLSGVERDGHSFTLGLISAVAQEAITAFALSPLSPNPSTGHSLVTFAIPARTRVRLTLIDVQGREVAVLADGIRQAGRYTAALDASDLHAGMYFVRMQAQDVNLTRRLVVVK
jgi:hypothetical protein